MAAPVWLWQPGESIPVLVGTLESTAGHTGNFTYNPVYVSAGGRALDPDQLRSPRKQGHKVPPESREGIPGLLADAGPDAWGRLMLAHDLGYEPSPFEALCRAPDDGAGNLAVGELDAKLPVRDLDLVALAEAIERRRVGLPVKDSAVLDVLSTDTALGGAKPKASVLRADGPWIAKFIERGDSPDMPYYEAAALRMGSRLGFDSAKVEVQPLSVERAALLIKRFDRTQVAGGAQTRTGMASALTVLGAGGQVPGHARSYLALADRLKRWVPDIAGVRRELWRRIVFNALMGNNDDHPRNHALLQHGEGWGLSPLFDVVPTVTGRERLSLAMPYLVTTDGNCTSFVTGENLIQAAPVFGWALPDAQAMIRAMSTQILDEWAAVLVSLDAPTRVTAGSHPVLDWVQRVQASAQAVDMLQIDRQLKPKREFWTWAP